MPIPLPLFAHPPTSPLELLTRARSLISDPSTWCTGAWSKSHTPTGPRIHSSGRVPTAHCVCLLGALERAALSDIFAHPHNSPLIDATLALILPHLPPQYQTTLHIGSWQDHASHTSVLRILDLAITSASTTPVS